MASDPRARIERKLAQVRAMLGKALKRVDKRIDYSAPDVGLPEITESEGRALDQIRKAYDSVLREWIQFVNQGPAQVVLNFESMSTEELKNQLRKSRGLDPL